MIVEAAAVTTAFIGGMEPRDVFTAMIVSIVVGALVGVLILLLRELRASRTSLETLTKESNVALDGLKTAVTYVGDKQVESAQINERTAQTLATALTTALLAVSQPEAKVVPEPKPVLSTRAKVATGGAGVLMVAGALVATMEGRSLIAYLDPVGIPTICEGVTKGVKLGDKATPAECDARLEVELRLHQAEVHKYVKVPMHPNTEAALISFVYNVGGPSFSKSTLLRKLNAGDTVGACNEMDRWVYAGGKEAEWLGTSSQSGA